MCIKAELNRMESERSIGSIIEWSGFKKLALSLAKEVKSLRTKTGYQAKQIKRLENQLKNYRDLQC